jgi:glycerophosphoryl diester phosphodiesterase
VKADVADPAYVKRLKDADLAVMVWNINTPEQWAKAVDAGADAVMTDEPDAFGAWAKAELS